MGVGILGICPDRLYQVRKGSPQVRQRFLFAALFHENTTQPVVCLIAFGLQLNGQAVLRGCLFDPPFSDHRRAEVNVGLHKAWPHAKSRFNVWSRFRCPSGRQKRFPEIILSLRFLGPYAHGSLKIRDGLCKLACLPKGDTEIVVRDVIVICDFDGVLK